MKIDKNTKYQIIIVAFLIMIVAAMYLNTLETRSVPYQESYQEPVYRTDTWQEPVYRTDYYTEKEQYTKTVPNTESASYTVRQKVCDDNGKMWLGLRFRAGISQYELINTDNVAGDFTLFVGMFLSDGKKVGQQMTRNVVAGGSAIFEYRLDINENITCTYNVISALKTTTNIVTKWNDVQKSKQVIDHYETKSKQVIDHYDTKYRTKYKDVTKKIYEWLVYS